MRLKVNIQHRVIRIKYLTKELIRPKLLTPILLMMFILIFTLSIWMSMLLE